MSHLRTQPVDLVIFGGGAAGLWLLDEAVRQGFNALLLEAHELGSGQTVASQGIIHGGLKYTLSGLLTPSAKAIAEMPIIWRRCLAGEQEPDLSKVRRRADFCYLWRSESFAGMIGMIGARAGLRTTTVKLDDHERPVLLRDCRGTVARIDEQVIDPASFVQVLADRHRTRLLKIDVEHGLEFEREGDEVRLIRLINPQTGEPLDLKAQSIVLAAGAGNAALLDMLNISSAATQTRPLHMVMARGDLPAINGHCVDGTSTRVTITTSTDSSGQTVWQIGGQIAEDGVEMSPAELVSFAVNEVEAVLPGVNLQGVEWSTYRADRAEPAFGGKRPDDVVIRREGNVIAAWPTKLALAPRLADVVLEEMKLKASTKPSADNSAKGYNQTNWPRPSVALPPWETATSWNHAD